MLQKFVFVVLIACMSGNLQAQQYEFGEKPPAAQQNLIPMLGEYHLGEEKIIIREDGGRLHAIINPTFDGSSPDTMKDWPLSFIAPGKYTYSFRGEFATFIFQFDSDGKSKSIVINNVTYNRNNIEPSNGNTFKVELDKTIDEYIEDALAASPPKEKGDFREPDLVDVTTVLENVKLDVRYSTTNNFLNAPTYSEAKSFLHRPAVMALNEANKRFNAMGYGIVVHDAYRPWYVTKIFWDATEGDERNFVANPDNGSIHNRGSAIDLTLYELKTGEVIKMVGTYDEMTDRSYPEYMGGTALERWHRALLRHVMEDVGFTVLENEWWHFDYKDWQEYPILNNTFDELVR
ncbi:M15 family metallopeptidase [Pseudemcibacter sp.]|uniref:M15 family metallopeptidase n=1 Tax=Pseudemcibacter sp. TaxID=2943293 RepID=UPI003F69F642